MESVIGIVLIRYSVFYSVGMLKSPECYSHMSFNAVKSTYG